MKVIDAQIHPYAADTPDRPWLGAPSHGGPAEAPAELNLKMMDEMGVDGAIAVTDRGVYGYDPSYAVGVAQAHPDRFAVIAQPDPLRPDIAEHIADWAACPVGVGLRLWLGNGREADYAAGRLDALLAAAQDHAQPIIFAAGQRTAEMASIAQRFPALQIVLDHLGLYPPVQPLPGAPFPSTAELLSHLPGVLELGRGFPNIAIKVSRAPTLSEEAYPYRDIWDVIRQVLAAFGPERAMWGTDWTTVTWKASYREAVSYIREIDGICAGDLAMLMGGAAERVFRWAPGA